MYTLLLILSATYSDVITTAVVPNMSYQECVQQINNIKANGKLVVESAQCVMQNSQQ